MLCAADIAARIGSLSEADVEAHHALLGAIGVTRDLAHSIPVEAVMKLLMFDNKRGYLRPTQDQIPMILLDKIGVLRRTGTVPLTAIPVSEVRQTLSNRTDRSVAAKHHKARSTTATTSPAAE